MNLSRTATYAIQAVVFIASQKNGQLVIGHNLAKSLELPHGFTLRLLVYLSKARILASVAGVNGGYRLARPANNITLLDVIEAVEGPFGGSIRGTSVAGAKLVRRLNAILQDMNEAARRQLSKVYIAELARHRNGRAVQTRGGKASPGK